MMSLFTIPTPLLSYYDWRLRRVVTIGTTSAPSSQITADTSYTIQRPNINESDVVEYDLWPITVNAPTGIDDVDDVGFLWWNPKTQKFSRTENVADYESTFSPTTLQQTYRINTAGFTAYGDPFVSRLVAYTPPTGDFIPYYTQGNYAQAVAGLVMSRDEWQALFDSGSEVIIPNLNMKVFQYGDGVKVIQNPDGTLGIVSDADGGLTAIRMHIGQNQWFWLTEFPQLDDLAIFEASQRLPTIISLIGDTNDTNDEDNANTPKSLTIAPPLAEQVQAPNASNPANPLLNGGGNLQADPFLGLGDNTGNFNPIRFTSLGEASVVSGTPQNPTKNIGLDVGKNATNSAPVLDAKVFEELEPLLQDLERLVRIAVRMANERIDARFVAALPQREVLSITDDPTSMSEDRQREIKQGAKRKQGDERQNESDTMRENAERNTPENRRARAMQLRYYYLGVS